MLCYNITNNKKSEQMKSKSENSNIIKFNPNPSREEAMNAVKTLIAWAGDNPNREV